MSYEIKKYKYPLFMCFIGAIFYSYEYVLRVVPSVIIPNLMNDLNIDAAEVGMIASYYFLSYTPLQVFVGTILDHFGVRKPLSFAIFCCAIGIYIFSIPTIFCAKLGMFLAGMGSAFAFVGVLKLTADWLPNKYFAIISGLTTAIGMIGAIGGETVTAVTINKFGIENSMNYLAIIGLILMFIVFFTIKDKVMLASTKYTNEFAKLFQDLFFVIKHKQIWVNGIVGLLLYTPTTIFAGLWGVPYLQMTRNLDAHQAGVIISMIFMGWMIGAPLSGLLSSYLKKQKIILIIGALLSFFVMMKILYFPSDSQTTTAIYMFLLGLFSSSEILIFAVAHNIIPNKLSGTAVSLTNMLVMVSGLMHVFIGYLLEKSVHYSGSIVSKPHVFAEADFQFALAILPAGLLLAFITGFFLKENYASKTSNN
jgi:sugar phosphate permease